MNEALDGLLEKLHDGSTDAAEQVFRICEPYLRKVARRRLSAKLRAKFDSGDVVQSVWANVLTGFRRGGWRFADAAHLRAFLARAAHNRLIDRARQHRRAAGREGPLADAGRVAAPRQAAPSECVQAQDVWERLLALCPPAHRGLLELRRQGLPLAEVAARTGLHEGSVRRILYELARRAAGARLVPGDAG